MSISQIITLIIGIILIGFYYLVVLWETQGSYRNWNYCVNDEQTATIVVNGGYSPSTVVLKGRSSTS